MALQISFYYNPYYNLSTLIEQVFKEHFFKNQGQDTVMKKTDKIPYPVLLPHSWEHVDFVSSIINE